MAYTYKDFVNAANNAGLMGAFSQDDLNRAEKNPEYGMGMLSIKKDYQSANDEQRILLDETANQLRKSYELPSTPVAQEALNGAPGFKYDRQDEYKQLLDDTISHGSFEWDVDKDPRWGAYKKNYLREGERAQANALAQASATSGGRASSYAATAAAQAGNYYASALSDVIPKLYNDAYGQYRDDFNLKLSQLEAMRKDKADKYNIYVDTLNDAWRKKQAEEAAQQQKFQNAMALYRQFGYAPNQEVADILGVSYGPPQRNSGVYYVPLPDSATPEDKGKDKDKDKDRKPSGHGKSPVRRWDGSFSKYGNTVITKW